MTNLLDALKAATGGVTQTKTEAPAKPKLKTQTKAQATEAKTQTKTQTKTDTPKTKGGAKYVIPKEFKQAIEDHLKGRPDMAEKMKQEGKSIDGCCEYLRRDEKACGERAQRKECCGYVCYPRRDIRHGGALL